MCDGAIYSVFPVQSHTMISKQAVLIFVLDFKSNSETEAICASPRGDAQDRIQPAFLQDRQGGDGKHEAPGRRWACPPVRCCISFSEQSLPVVFGNYRCPDFENWAHTTAYFICPCNYGNCDHSCGNRTCKQSIRHPGWKMALLLLCSKPHFQLYLAGWAPPVRSPWTMCRAHCIPPAENEAVQSNQSFPFSPPRQCLLETAVQIVIHFESWKWNGINFYWVL